MTTKLKIQLKIQGLNLEATSETPNIKVDEISYEISDVKPMELVEAMTKMASHVQDSIFQKMNMN